MRCLACCLILKVLHTVCSWGQSSKAILPYKIASLRTILPTGQGALTGFEFEPTYWFGALEIPGLKPLPTNLIEDIRSLTDENGAFDLWVESNGAHQLEYLFKLNGKIVLATRPDTSYDLTREVPARMPVLIMACLTNHKVKRCMMVSTCRRCA